MPDFLSSISDTKQKHTQTAVLILSTIWKFETFFFAFSRRHGN